MSERIDDSAQVDAEQRQIDSMYAHIDAEVESKEGDRQRALARPVEGPAELRARDLEVARTTERIRQLGAAEHALCFGRLDFSDAAAPLHIGRLGLRSETGDPLLVDWRAEAARPFYAATLAAPLGVRRRRHLRLDGRRVADLTDEILDGSQPTDDDLVGDGPLAAALGAARTGRMREAAATLQSEQDQIVRSEHRGVMVVDGGPGTGKTIVALHRAAYVLYAFESLAERGVLVYGPNQRFLTYISDVLPSLGENDVQLATMEDLVGTSASRAEPDRITRLKGRAALADVLARRVRDHQPDAIPLELKANGETVILNARLVDAARRRALQGELGHNPARAVFAENVVDDLVAELERRTSQEQSDYEDELLAAGIDVDRLAAKDLGPRLAGDEGELEIDWEGIREQLLDDPGIEAAITTVWPRLDADEVVRSALADVAALSVALPEASPDDLALMSPNGAKGWSSAELALLDESRALIDGPPEAVYGHVVVDEAQQLSEMAWRMLMRRSPSRSMTIVGDLAQAGPTTTVGSWDEALAPFVGDRLVHHRLTINYRTTDEILAATEPLLAQIAPDQELSTSIRHGEEPRTVGVPAAEAVTRLRALIAETIAAHPGELVGVVATADRAGELESAIDPHVATVVAAPEARGLEFDTVVILDPDGILNDNEAGLRDLYVAQTRATQRLITLEVNHS